MSVPSQDAPIANARSRWLRIVKIIALHTLLAPLIVGGMIFAVEISEHLFAPRDVVRDVLFGLGVVSLFCMIIAVPWALLTSTIFAVIAVLSGWRHVFVSLAIALLPAIFFLTSSGNASAWYLDIKFPASAIVLIVLPTTICWYLTRRWHSPNA